MWSLRYRHSVPGAAAEETSIFDTWRRVAGAVASVEKTQRRDWERRFLQTLEGFRFLPGGRILASAGTDLDATLFNCFVIEPVEDSVPKIFDRLKDSALTLHFGGGIGCDFSGLPPASWTTGQHGRAASGPVAFLKLWSSMCTTLLSASNRRGAMMGTLRCDHPDILAFVDAKRESGALTNFNLSVQITEAFMQAASVGADWALSFSRANGKFGTPASPDRTPTEPNHTDTTALRVPASELWRKIIDAAYDTGEPGVLFVDRINALNNLHYCEHITTTNPCGEIPLPGFGACDLGSVNLAVHVKNPFAANAEFDLEAIDRLARDATRFLDNVIDLSPFPLQSQQTEARATRRIGLGITGLADALIMLGHRYDSLAARDVARIVLTRIRDAAYEASIDLAREKGVFPRFDKVAFLDGAYAGTLPAHIRDGIAKHGLRNSHLMAIAPTGSISILANNVSSGIEPVFAPVTRREIRGENQQTSLHRVRDFAFAQWQDSSRRSPQIPRAFVTADEVSPGEQLLMVAALQPIVDNAISKTVNVPESISRRDFGGIYATADDLGLKGCTVYRPDSSRPAVLARWPTCDSTHGCFSEDSHD